MTPWNSFFAYYFYTQIDSKIGFGGASIPAFSSACIGHVKTWPASAPALPDENSGRWLCQKPIFESTCI